MANTTITALPTANTIDATQDWLPIDTTSLATTQKINRNTLLGITGSPVGTTDTQALTNKTIGNTNTVTLKDTLFTLQDDGDTTKQARFQLSGITTATTRTYTLPNASSTLADIATAQTFTNKTLTSPTITGGTITGSTIAVDSISGQSVSTVVSVAGLSISAGVLNTNNSVITANIADTAVTPNKLQTGAGTGWAYQAYVPTWTNVTVGNGTVVASYVQTGKTVVYRLSFVLGSTSAVSGTLSVSLPVTAASYTTPGYAIGQAFVDDTTVASYPGTVVMATTTTAQIYIPNTSTDTRIVLVSNTKPSTWSVGDSIKFTVIYEAA